MGDLPSQDLRLTKYRLRVGVRLDEWRDERVAARLAAKDQSLWPAAEPRETTSRLGWLDLATDGILLLEQFHDFATSIERQGIKRVFLIGMGGSSLAPEVFERTFGRGDERFVEVLDSTHPDAVRRAIDLVDSDKYMFIVASKSGSTLETRNLFQAAWHAMERWHSQPGLRFVAITDANSTLEHVADRLGFERVFTTPPDVGGRFSALSYFGLVPGSLSGAHVERLLDRARAMQEASTTPDGPALALGAALGELALAGRDKLTFLASPAVSSFPAWLEQLVAESLGKDGKGIVPVVGEPPGEVESYGEDRVFVGLVLAGQENGIPELLAELEAAGHPVIEIRLRDHYDLGAEIMRWQIAVAAAGIALEVQPFDQPDVERTKELTREMLSGEAGSPKDLPELLDGGEGPLVRDALTRWFESMRRGDYIAVQTFIAPNPELDRSLRSLQGALRDATGCATTAGYGPRFLHSTGQLHKGGPNNGVFLQLLDHPGSDLLVPQEDYSFATLIEAQAAGDAAALVERERRLLRVRLSAKPAAILLRLRDIVLSGLS